MTPPRVVPPLDELEQRRLRLGVRRQRRPVEELALQGREEALPDQAAPRSCSQSKQSPTEPIDSATPQSRQRAPKANEVYWAALIGVMDDRHRPPLVHGHLQRLDHQRGTKMPRHGPTDDAPAEHVEDDSQVQKTGQGRHVGDVGDSEPVRRVRLEATLTRSGAGRAWAFRRVVRGPRRRLTPAMPADRITRATRLRLTATPPSVSSA